MFKNKRNFRAALVAIILILIGGGILLFRNQTARVDTPQIGLGDTKETPQNIPVLTQVAANLTVPWSLAFLPSGDLLFTERPGRVRIVDKEEGLLQKPLLEIDEAEEIGEGGLLGVAVHPDFEKNGFVYFYYTYQVSGENVLNRVVRYKFDGTNFSDKEILVAKIPGASNHNGGRIKFGPDGFLYIGTGDAEEPSLAQNKASLAGKILRVTEDGKRAPGNPFGDMIYSYGHRNVQGLAWDSQGRLWATEHGPSATDELNLISPGENYGWPLIRGDEEEKGMINPILHSGLGNTWAPSGGAFFRGSVFFTGLRGQTLYEAVVDGDKVRELKEHFKGELGRIRDVVVGPDGFLYIATNNTDGRGAPKKDDDKILRLNPEKF